MANIIIAAALSAFAGFCLGACAENRRSRRTIAGLRRENAELAMGQPHPKDEDK